MVGAKGIPRNPREWVQTLHEYRGDGTNTCGSFAGMEFIAAGNPRVCFGKHAIIRFHTDSYFYTPTDGDQSRTNRQLFGPLLKQSPFCVGSSVKCDFSEPRTKPRGV